MSDGTLNLPVRNSDPATPSSGRVKVWVDAVDKKPRTTDDAGVTSGFESAFGQNFAFAKETNPATNNTSTPQTYVSRAYDIVSIDPSRIYRVMAKISCGYSTGTRDFRARLTLNGNEIADEEVRVEQKDSGGDQRIPYVLGPFYLTGAEMIQAQGNFELQYYAQQNGDVARAYYGLIEFWRAQ